LRRKKTTLKRLSKDNLLGFGDTGRCVFTCIAKFFAKEVKMRKTQVIPKNYFLCSTTFSPQFLFPVSYVVPTLHKM
jgi:hypothetical protein